MAEHKWTLSWPGNFCLKCGLEDPTEDTENSLIDCGCEGNPECKECVGTGAKINPKLIIPPCPID